MKNTDIAKKLGELYSDIENNCSDILEKRKTGEISCKDKDMTNYCCLMLRAETEIEQAVRYIRLAAAIRNCK